MLDALFGGYTDSRLLLIEAMLMGPPRSTLIAPVGLKLYKNNNEPGQREQLENQMRAGKLPVGHSVDRQRKGDHMELDYSTVIMWEAIRQGIRII
ncbi:hypothetical protein J1614_001934 [Plenodomus biglobosus]|nr:hypothetical protein J1614_001934 [Plenodomus biglobosus]